MVIACFYQFLIHCLKKNIFIFYLELQMKINIFFLLYILYIFWKNDFLEILKRFYQLNFMRYKIRKLI